MLFAGFGSLVDLSIPRCYYFWLLFDQPVLLEITPGKARSPIGLSKSEESVRIAGARLFTGWMPFVSPSQQYKAPKECMDPMRS